MMKSSILFSNIKLCLPYLLILFLLSNTNAVQAQCADNTELYANRKCFELIWNTTPSSLPDPIIVTGLGTYNLVSGAGTSASPAVYEIEGINGNCSGSQNLFDGSAEIDNNLCTYINGVLSSSSPLPVELVSFESYLFEDKILLEWHTATELNNSGFFVEKSLDAFNWIELGWVAGFGTTNAAQHYQFLDEYPDAGTNYYRLRQVDYSGYFEYSSVIGHYFDQHSSVRAQIFPNPASSFLTVTVSDPDQVIYSINLFNSNGQKMELAVVQNQALDVSGLRKGMYFLVLHIENQTLTERFMIQ